MDRSVSFDTVVVFAVAVLGITIIFNPFYFYPDGGGDIERTYRVSQVGDEGDNYAFSHAESVLICPMGRVCVLEERILENGPIVADNDTNSYFHKSQYSVVMLDERLYVPDKRVRNNTTVLTLEEVNATEAAERVAIPADEQPKAVREAIETGSVTVYDRKVWALERSEIIEHDGKYYQALGFETRRPWTADGQLAVVRAVLFLLGSALVAASGWYFRKLSA